MSVSSSIQWLGWITRSPKSTLAPTVCESLNLCTSPQMANSNTPWLSWSLPIPCEKWAHPANALFGSYPCNSHCLWLKFWIINCFHYKQGRGEQSTAEQNCRWALYNSFVLYSSFPLIYEHINLNLNTSLSPSSAPPPIKYCKRQNSKVAPRFLPPCVSTLHNSLQCEWDSGISWDN